MEIFESLAKEFNIKDEYSKKEGKINIIVDDFFGLYPIKNFEKMLNYSRGINIIFTPKILLQIRNLFKRLKN